MSRCPRLDYEDHGIFSGGEYICTPSGQHMDTDDPKVKFTCNTDSGCEYEKCPIYINTK